MSIFSPIQRLMRRNAAKQLQARYNLHSATPDELYGEYAPLFHQVQAIAANGDFETLEQLWNEAWESQARTASGVHLFQAIPAWFESFFEDSNQHEQFAVALDNAYNTNRTPLVSGMLASAHAEAAFEERGGEWAHKVKESQWSGFRANMEAAHSILGDTYETAGDHFAWWDSFYTVNFYGGGDAEAVNYAFNKLWDLSPSNVGSLSTFGIGLLPRWKGTSSADVEDFARAAMERTESELGRGAYALVHCAFPNIGSLPIEDTKAEARFLEASCMDLIERFPGQGMKIRAANLMVWAESGNGLANVFNTGLTSVDHDLMGYESDEDAISALLDHLVIVDQYSRKHSDGVALRNA